MRTVCSELARIGRPVLAIPRILALDEDGEWVRSVSMNGEGSPPLRPNEPFPLSVTIALQVWYKQ